jgi:hypothetical protein
MTAGVSPRRVAIDLAARYLAEEPLRSAVNFRRWLGHLDPELLSEDYGLTGAALEATARAVFKSTPNEYLVPLDQGSDFLPVEVGVRPLRSARSRGLLSSLTEQLQLVLDRDYDSLVNRNAVLLTHAGNNVGYLPWAAAQAVAPELDAGTTLRATVLGVDDSGVIRIRVERQ